MSGIPEPQMLLISKYYEECIAKIIIKDTSEMGVQCTLIPEKNQFVY
jgi:hypothetical protein